MKRRPFTTLLKEHEERMYIILDFIVNNNERITHGEIPRLEGPRKGYIMVGCTEKPMFVIKLKFKL